MGIFQRPDSRFWWLYLEPTKRREKTNILVDRRAPANRQAAARRAAEARYAARMLELAAQDTDRLLDDVGSPATATAPPSTPDDPIPESPWMNAQAAGRYLSKGRNFVFREVQAGRLRAAKIGGRGEILTRAEWLDEYVMERVSLAARRKLRRV